MDGVNTHHKDFDAYSPKWRRCRDTSDGQDAVHAAGEAYLPKLKDQEPEDYKSYKGRAVFYNATWRTIGGLIGMMFRKPPTTEIPAAIKEFTTDIDMAGTSLETFARKVALEVMEVGRVGMIVDHPAVDAAVPLTVKAAEQQGLRPMIRTYRAECIVNWKYRRVRNHWVLAMVVLQETVEEPDGEFKVKPVEQWRVLDLDDADQYRVRLFRKADGKAAGGQFVQIGEDVLPLMSNKRLDFIPFYIVGPDGVDSELDEPPLIDLVDVNLSHYRTTADYEHGCHFTGLPTAVVSGYAPDPALSEKFYIGSTSAWVFPDPQAKASFLEFTGQGLGALKENLDRKEQQMAILGARMLFAEKRAVEAAETASIHRTGEASVLAAIATAVSEALEKALQTFSDWAGGSGKVVYQLNRDFNPAGLGAADLTAYLKAVQAGEMSSQSFFDLLQRHDVVDPELTYEAEQERIAANPPPAPVVPANDAGGVGAVA